MKMINEDVDDEGDDDYICISCDSEVNNIITWLCLSLASEQPPDQQWSPHSAYCPVTQYQCSALPQSLCQYNKRT